MAVTLPRLKFSRVQHSSRVEDALPKVFISYRREDTAECAHGLYKAFVSAFGKERVFFDLDTIPGGVPFRDYIREQLPKFDVVVALIGVRWEGPKENGKRRLSDLDDPVRVELATAIAQGKMIIPVYADQAPYLKKKDLPKSLRRLAELNGMRIDNRGRDLDVHTNRIIDVIRHSIEQHRPAPARSSSSFGTNELFGVFDASRLDLRWWPFAGLLTGSVFSSFMYITGRTDFFEHWAWDSLVVLALPFSLVLSMLMGPRLTPPLGKLSKVWLCTLLALATTLGASMMEPWVSIAFDWPRLVTDPWQLAALMVPINTLPALVAGWAIRSSRSKWLLPFLGLLSGWLVIGSVAIGLDPLADLLGIRGFKVFDLLGWIIIPLFHATLFSAVALVLYIHQRNRS